MTDHDRHAGHQLSVVDVLQQFGVWCRALDDLSEGVRAVLGDGPIPDELTREIAVTVGNAA